MICARAFSVSMLLAPAFQFEMRVEHFIGWRCVSLAPVLDHTFEDATLVFREDLIEYPGVFEHPLSTFARAGGVLRGVAENAVQQQCARV